MAQSPTRNYTVHGTYNVSLNVIGHGGINTYTETNYITAVSVSGSLGNIFVVPCSFIRIVA